MNRRTLLQVITAFFVSLFASFRRLPELGATALRKLPFVRGQVSPAAAWFSPPTYEATTAVSAETLEEMVLAFQKGVELPISPFWYTNEHSRKHLEEWHARHAANTPFQPLVTSEYELEPQEGQVVMILKNPAVRGRDRMPSDKQAPMNQEVWDPEIVQFIEANHEQLLRNFGQS